ncbi:MAG: hypothetical protein WD872_01825 [Pirellulaceae bacterium]
MQNKELDCPSKPKHLNLSKLPAKASRGIGGLDSLINELAPEQRQALAQKALERKLDIDAQAAEADERYSSSTRDMDETVRLVRAFENSTKSDYTVRADYRTASGTTNVEIKKATNTVIIVIAVAIVIGFVAVLMFSK